MLRKLERGLFVGSLVALAACGTARVIHRDQARGVGVIELQGDHGKAMEQAIEEMAAHCGPDNFIITEEGEEAIGTDTYAREDQATDSNTSKSGRREATDTTTTQTQSTRTATALRVHYACGGAAVGAGGPPPGGPPPGGPPSDNPPPPPGQQSPPPPPPR